MDIDENIEDYANTIDVTPFFWNLIRDIVSMDYETLKQTQSFQRLVYCVNEYDFKYSLSFDEGNTILYFDDINDLFYETLSFYKKRVDDGYEALMCVTLLEKAIQKMELFVETENMASLFIKALNL